ncbi:hypothetical protein GXY_08445 [Novacetimonas hansenii ATCC 23769]|uniref:Uncharacterized protein n=1 Tax=Novacetimonas hansenii ATCC 23769 TaxID=714995 RepID=D5QEX4_NOVHA|nr:hypothetical protein GXY_08445 [Novacetimonas hansenii ATCC 23769]
MPDDTPRLNITALRGGFFWICRYIKGLTVTRIYVLDRAYPAAPWA